MVTLECVSGGGKLSFIVCQETGGIASAFYLGFARERVPKDSTGNATLCCDQYITCQLQVE
jgi:hypothetical protein